MAPDQFESWLGERFAVARTVADDGFSKRILAELNARARRDRVRQLILVPVLVLGAVLTAGHSTPLVDLLLGAVPSTALLPSLDGLSNGLVNSVQALGAQQVAVVAAGAMTIAASAWLLADESF